MFDNVGSEPLAVRMYGGRWKQHALYRRVGADGKIAVTFAMTGIGIGFFDNVRIEPAIVAPGETLHIRVAVRASGGDFENDLICQIDNDPEVGRVDKRQVRLTKGRSEEIVFERAAPRDKAVNSDTPYQVTVRLVNSDLLPYDDVRHHLGGVCPRVGGRELPEVFVEGAEFLLHL